MEAPIVAVQLRSCHLGSAMLDLLQRMKELARMRVLPAALLDAVVAQDSLDSHNVPLAKEQRVVVRHQNYSDRHCWVRKVGPRLRG